ncbi:hypothetical protein TBLA_0A07330 [Henningerozyma blattae CBS 6284]|uniref:Ras-associating domain-containing protein n=1 Tax=Henningerozyma blattae (strain ATCC 34711 / CBS 6284 / DSM 70876 / NBRC 10599 / NRRL Y-10934 / UCD 77-7) TaxID=1071380 RepID=I2GWM0_HENB6|nr:hypothetical protein TBLA_0A07330 [Tetrapisispora blattae CBS 6284]CCH58522.1 hypothetical protein TBLA_0A07330 [Tetrapisispora blattae CBS 6284]
MMDYENWSIEETSIWADKFELGDKFLEHGIDGSLLKELEMNDCKEICGGDKKKAVMLKMNLNQLVDDGGEGERKEIVAALKNLYNCVNQKLIDYQSQYSRLRLDVLELSKSAGVTTGAGTVAAGVGVGTGTGANSGAISNTPSPTEMDHPSKENLVKESTPSMNEPLKHLRASKDDSCERILRSAMKRYKLNDQDWKQYVLVICYGDQERILELDERPVVIFKNLRQRGLHPAIMLRRRGDFEELDINDMDPTPGGKL